MNPVADLSRPRLAGIGFATASAFTFALLNVTVRFCGPYLSVWQMVFARSVFGVAAMLMLARFTNVSIWGRERLTLLLAGVASIINVVCLMSAILILPLFEALVLLYLYPLFAALISPVICGDRLSKIDWFGIALGFIGAILVLWPDNIETRLSIGHLFALVAAFCYALTMTLIRRVISFNPPLVPFFYISLVGCLVGLLPAVWEAQPISLLPAQGWAGLAGIAVFAALAYLACSKALVYLPSHQVGVISTTEVVFTSILGFLLFNESIGKLALLGGGFILAGGLFLSMEQRLMCE